MSDEEMGKNYESGLRLMMHVFYCRQCPPVARVSHLWWVDSCSPATMKIVVDWRDAQAVSAIYPGYSISFGDVSKHFLCDEGFQLAMKARARGWGA